ncbi:MAG TPA: lytic transglycosylase, partial [Gammaproteobacteria bacterium]|nr:lytic transglycosylase [Gammaproteobacteria bacterium]
MNGLAYAAAAFLAALLSGCAQLTALHERDGAAATSLAREALEHSEPARLQRDTRPARPIVEEPFRVEGTHADLWERLRAGFRLDPGPDEGVAGELAFYSGNGDFVRRALERGRPYLHHIVERLDRRGLPLELALLPVVESAFQPTAYSRAKASGLWQFIPATGKRFGLPQNGRYDGRRDVVASTEAALDYLSELNARFGGDWPLTLAAYNWGERNVERAIEANREAGRPTDYWSLKVPRETRAYVPRLLAVVRMLKDPKRYALSLEPLPNRPYFAAVEVPRDVRLDDVAQQLGLKPAELERLNPGYHRGVTGGGSHAIAVPVTHVPALLSHMDSLSVAKVAVAAVEEREETPARDSYRVRKGDTLGGIAGRFGVNAAQIRRANGLVGNTIRAGQRLFIPATGSKARSPAVETRVASQGFRGGKRGVPAEARLHTVARGDTLWHVSRRYQMPIEDLAALNGLARSA